MINSSKPTNKFYLKAFLEHKLVLLFVFVIGIMIGLPTLWGGWGNSDDILQRQILLSSSLPKSITSLYQFMDPEINHEKMDIGIFPWWTNEGARVKFFRPLAVFSLWLDYQIWPNSSLLMHLHSLILYGILCLLAAILYRRIYGVSAISGLAAILFALSILHIGSVTSLAARNLILTLLFGILTILFHDHSRKSGNLRWIIPGILCFTLSLLSSENGIAVFGFLLAYELFLDRVSFKNRLGILLPYAFIMITWLLVYQANSFGAWGSGFYINPIYEPIIFLKSMFEQTPLLLMGQFFLPEPLIYGAMSIGAKSIYWGISIFVLTILGFLLTPTIRRSRIAQFWCFAMLLDLILVCAARPASGRHLMFVSLSAFALISHFIVQTLTNGYKFQNQSLGKRISLVTCFILLGIHTFFYPILCPIIISTGRKSFDGFSHAVTDFSKTSKYSNKDLVIVNAPSPGQMIYVPGLHSFYDQPMPEHIRLLSPAFSPVTVTSVDENTVTVQPHSGYLLSPGTSIGINIFSPTFHLAYAYQYGDRLFRGENYPLKLGQQIHLVDFDVEIMSLTEDGRPLEVKIQFEQPLNDPSRIWLKWDWKNYQYEPFIVPSIGSSITIPGPAVFDSGH